MIEEPSGKGRDQRGDVITSFDASIIHDMHELPRVVANTPVGKKVKIDILRQGKSSTLSPLPLKEVGGVGRSMWRGNWAWK